MTTLLDVVAVACYLSLLIELTVLHTPSVASSRAILSADDAAPGAHSDRFRRWFQMSPLQKLLRFVLPLVVIYAVFAYPPLELWLGPALLGDFVYRPNTLVTGAAIVLLVIGRGFTLASVFALRRHAAADHRALQTRWIFRVSRNPGLVGMYIMFLGFWLAMPSAIFALGIVVYVVHMHLKVQLEEDYLGHRFGADFEDYRRRTPRYLL